MSTTNTSSSGSAQQPSEHHHHHHHHKRDGASRFKEKQLNAIVMRTRLERWLKKALIVVAIFMVIAVFIAYTIL